MSYITRHLMSDERVARETRLTATVYLPALALLAVSAALFIEVYAVRMGGPYVRPLPWAFLALALIAAVPAFLRRASSDFAVTNRRVIVKTGLLRRHSTEILLRQVEGITVDQGIAGRIFNFGTIIVEGTGVDRTPYRGISAPLKFRLAVQEQVEASMAGSHAPAANPETDPFARLTRLRELKDKGLLDENEFAREKQRILGSL
ncbi:MAG TPA: PH domain-containing protein [Opitutaceae bacterium]